MSHAVTLNVPDSWLPSLERAARATRQPVEKLLLRAVQAALSTVDDVPPLQWLQKRANRDAG